MKIWLAKHSYNIAILLVSGFFCSCGVEEKETVEIKLERPSKLTLISWSEYFDPEVLAKFEEETGIEIEYLSFDDPDELEARLKSEPGVYDVVVADSTSIDRLSELRLIQKLDRSSIPNFKNVAPEYLDRTFDPKNQYSAPYAWGTTLVAYRADKIENPGDSWKILSDETYKGKVMFIQDRTEALGVSLISQGLPMNSSSRENVEAAGAWLSKQMDSVGLKFGSDSVVRDSLDDGSIWVATCYSGDAAMVAAENENVAFFIPKEGAPKWMDNFAVPSDSSHAHASMELINFMLRKDIAADNSNFTWYASPNSAAEAEINEELLSDASINPPKSVRDKCFLFEKPGAEREELMNEVWLKVWTKAQKNGLVGLPKEPEPSETTAQTKLEVE